MKSVQDRAEELAAELEGTCDAANGERLDEIEATHGLAEALGDLVYLCPQCGWWVDVAERTESEDGEDVCADCADENDDDGDEE